MGRPRDFSNDADELHMMFRWTALLLASSTAIVALVGRSPAYPEYDLRQPTRTEAEVIGSQLVVEPTRTLIGLPLEWVGEKSAAPSLTCGHDVHGAFARRLAVLRPMLDSARNATGEWDREYSAVTDSIMPFEALIAQLGPEPFGRGGCFLDLQMRVYLSTISPAIVDEAAATIGLSTARRFFPSASIASRDSAAWHIDHLRWDAHYSDYGGEANVELYSTETKGRTLTLVFLHATSSKGPAAIDQAYVLSHILGL